MTIPEQAGKVATTTVEAMKGHPGLLALIVLQLLQLGVLGFLASANSDRQQARELALIERCVPKGD